jgi:hypothetical protein
MSKFLKLSQINKDIEILEDAGQIKAADILHKKFIREAQNPQVYKPSSTDDSPTLNNPAQTQNTNSGPRPYNELLNQIFMNAGAQNSIFDPLYQEYKTNLEKYPPDDQGYLTAGVNRALSSRQRQNLPLPAGATAPAKTPGPATNTTTGPRSWVANSGVTVTIPGSTPAPASNTAPAATSAPAVSTGQSVVTDDPTTQRNFGNSGGLYNTTGNNSTTHASEVSSTQAPAPPSKDAPNPAPFEKPAGHNTNKEEFFENNLYSTKIKEIASLLQNNYSFAEADKVYVETIKNFKNKKRWDKFFAQYNYLRYHKYQEWLRSNDK